MEAVDKIVIGSGSVGPAVAASLAMSGREVMILEGWVAFGTQTSARNSEVIHGSLYYPKDSRKGALCVCGKELIYRSRTERNIPHRRLGKLLIATDTSELAALAGFAQRAASNGVPLEPPSTAEVLRLEPGVRAIAGLYSESTGILDSHQFMVTLLGDAEQTGATLVTHTPVVAGKSGSDGFLLRTGGYDRFELRCRMVVNSAGLHAPELARRLENFPTERVPPTFYTKGHYFTRGGRAPFRHLVNQMPNHADLRIHVTLDLGGQCKFGPDVSGWAVSPDYSFEAGLEDDKFYRAIRRYYRGLPEASLQPGYMGIRPKVVGPTQPAGDFIVQGPDTHGLSGLVNLFGIESPGLTSCLAIAEKVEEALNHHSSRHVLPTIARES